MQHHFDTEHAKEYGILEAVLINHFSFWIAKNKANKKNYFEGRYWTYNSNKALAELFPYVSESQIRRALDKLVSIGVLVKGNFSVNSYDRTLWYSFGDNCNLQNEQIHLTNSSNGSNENVNSTITDNKTYNLSDKEGVSSETAPPKKSFKVWTKEEFQKELEPFSKKNGGKHDSETLRAFYVYWSELNPKGKMRVQLQETWETNLRIETWTRKEYNNPKWQTQPTAQTVKKPEKTESWD